MSDLTDDQVRKLADDCILGAKCLEETGTFETGQGILRDAARALLTARADAKAAQALVVEEATKQLAAARETFCYASPGSDEEFTSLLLGFDTAAGIIRDLADVDGLAEVAKLRAERDEWKTVSETLSEMSGNTEAERDTLAAELAELRALCKDKGGPGGVQTSTGP